MTGSEEDKPETNTTCCGQFEYVLQCKGKENKFSVCAGVLMIDNLKEIPDDIGQFKKRILEIVTQKEENKQRIEGCTLEFIAFKATFAHVNNDDEVIEEETIEEQK